MELSAYVHGTLGQVVTHVFVESSAKVFAVTEGALIGSIHGQVKEHVLVKLSA